MLWLLLLLPGFSEIMPDPMGADNNLEYVEISWNTSIENETFVLADATSNDTVEYVTTIGNGSEIFLLFVEEGYNYSIINTTATCHIFSVGTTIGNNLGNANDSLELFFNNTSITTNYTVAGCAQGEGCSLSFNDSWIPTEATPCNANIFPQENVTINETVCNHSFSLSADTFFSVGETISYKPIIEPKPENLTIIYWWENVFGDIIKDAQETTNTNEKRYTPKQPTGERDWVLFAKMSFDACNETYIAEKMVVVKGIEQEEKTCPAPTVCSSGGSAIVVSTPENKEPILTATLPESISETNNLSITATIYNEEYSSKKFNVSAYVYRGSKNFTPRTSKEITVEPYSGEGIPFTLSGLEPGEYSVKVKAVKEGRKTPYEETRTITVTEQVEQIVQIQIEDTNTSNTTQIVSISPPLVPITGSAIAAEKSSSKWWISLVLALGLFLVAKLR